jgi:hypothetical protein
MRISSTQLGSFLDCPAKWYMTFVEGHGMKTSEAMATGTVFHAIEEFVHARRTWPLRRDIYAWPGNYQPTSEAMDAFPRAFDVALAAAKRIGAPWKNEHLKWLNWEEAILEQDVEEWGVSMCDGAITCGGYIDGLFPEQQVVFDWKTRRSFQYAPDAEELASNVQLNYYAALAARHLDWDRATVVHANVERKSGRLQVVRAEISRGVLDMVWEYLEESLGPRMLRCAAQENIDVVRDEGACFKYGPCQHMSYCNSGGSSEQHDNGGGIFDSFDLGAL